MNVLDVFSDVLSELCGATLCVYISQAFVSFCQCVSHKMLAEFLQNQTAKKNLQFHVTQACILKSPVKCVCNYCLYE